RPTGQERRRPSLDADHERTLFDGEDAYAGRRAVHFDFDGPGGVALEMDAGCEWSAIRNVACTTDTTLWQHGHCGVIVLPPAPSRYANAAWQCGQGPNHAYAIRISSRCQPRRTISCTPHPTQNIEPWRRATACCSPVHWRGTISAFTTAPHSGQYAT